MTRSQGTHRERLKNEALNTETHKERYNPFKIGLSTNFTVTMQPEISEPDPFPPPALELKLVQKNRSETKSAKKPLRLLIPELMALTLTTNREALAIVRSLEPYVAGAPFTPEEKSSDGWINYRASAPGNSGRYRATANERVRERKRVLSSTPDGVPMPEAPPPVIEHVSIRAHFVRYVTPQLRKKEPKEEGRRLILATYSLTGRWLFFHVAKVRPPYRNADLFTTKRTAHLIFGPQWAEFIERIRNTAREAAERDRVAVLQQFFVHVAADARWSSGLTAHSGEDVQFVKDMPKEDESGDRLMISVLRRAGTDVNKLEFLFTSEPAPSV